MKKKKKKAGKKLGGTGMSLEMYTANLHCASSFSAGLVRAVEENDVSQMRLDHTEQYFIN